MKSYSSIGDICLKGDYNEVYRLCSIAYVYHEDDSFKYVFTPNYSIIDLLDDDKFSSIPGLNLDLRRKEYIRENKVPCFIIERVPQENRVDYYDFLNRLDMEYMDPIKYLIKTDLQYFGDELFVLPHKEKEVIEINQNNDSLKNIFKFICSGDDIKIGDYLINDDNRGFIYKLVLIGIKDLNKTLKNKQHDGLIKAKDEGKLTGRKPIKVNHEQFMSYLNLIKYKQISPKEAAKEMNISIDKFYRYKNSLKN